MEKLAKLNIGSGRDIKPGYINLDIVQLDGVDIVHDLTEFPYPFKDNGFNEISMVSVLEHLPNTVKTMEELHRIGRNKCLIHIRVPYWNGSDSFTDPTHVKFFNEKTLNFFDPSTPQCQKRQYYTPARFKILNIGFYIYFFNRYWKIENKILKKLIGLLARHFCNVVQDMDIDLQVIK